MGSGARVRVLTPGASNPGSGRTLCRLGSYGMPPERDHRPQLILVFGGPGAGKGTQASLLSQLLRMPHISSGDLLREHQRRDTQNVMSSGELLPDELVTRVVLARLEQPDAVHGAILDGFPRTVAQARALDTWLEQRGGAIGAAFSQRPKLIAHF